MPQSPDLTEFSRALGAIYDAGLDRSKWSIALEKVFRLCGGVAAQMYIRSSADQGVFGCVSGVPLEMHDEYVNHYAEHDLRFHRLRDLPKGEVYRESDLITPAEIAASPIYNELLPRYDLGSVMVVDLPVRDLNVFFSILGRGSLKHFESRSVAEFQRFVPHLSRAVEIQSRFHEVEDQLRSSLDALEVLPIGIVLLDERGRVRFANRRALRLASDVDVRITRAGLDVSAARIPRKLDVLIADALRTASGRGIIAGGVVRVRSATGTTLLQVVPLPRSSRENRTGAWDGIATMVILGRPEVDDPQPIEALRRLYDLSPVEADLAAQLLKGRKVQDIAADRRVSVHTVRTQLKAVLSKAEVSRQAEFVAKTWSALVGFDCR